MRASLFLCAIFGACSGPPPPAPAAVINATPSSVCYGDDFRTSIHLDSRGTSPDLTLIYTKPDPDAGVPTTTWTFLGNTCQDRTSDPTCDIAIDPGSVEPSGAIDFDTVTFTMRGDKPVQVSLRVQNAAGGVTETATTISITPLDDAGVCPLPQ